jgi:high-affinity Fe2+/Pb2+ permease
MARMRAAAGLACAVFLTVMVAFVVVSMIHLRFPQCDSFRITYERLLICLL